MRTIVQTFRSTKPAFLLVTLLLAASSPARAQELPAPVEAKEVASAALDLDGCIALGLANQPAIAAARSSLAAAQSGLRGIDSIRHLRILSPDLPIRRQQACLGIQIANAGLFQAEWDNRYAVTRNYYSVIYAKMQLKVLDSLVGKLDRAAKTAQDFVDLGDPTVKATSLDVDNLKVNRDLYKARRYEASVGVEKAMAALREAIGVDCNFKLEVIEDELPALVADLNQEQLTALALSQRGEMAQVLAANRVTDLEIVAQSKIRSPSGRTFASGADIHAKPVPTGVSNTEYRPGAEGLEMPPFLAGHKSERMQRARDFHARAGAVVAKTENLIKLEVEAAYLKWQEAGSKAVELRNSIKLAESVADRTQKRFDATKGAVSGEELIRSRTLSNQIQANYNEAVYFHALALAALERITAGGYAVPRNPK